MTAGLMLKAPIAACALLATAFGSDKIEIGLSGGASYAGEAVEARVWIAVHNLGASAKHGAAYDVRAAVSLGRRSVSAGRLTARLATNDVSRAQVSVGAADLRPGRHIAVGRVAYRDSMGYPYETLIALPVTTANLSDAPPPPLAVTVRHLIMDNRGACSARLRNTGAVDLALALRLYLPTGLTAAFAATNLVVAANSESVVEWPIERVGLPPGTRQYGLMAVGVAYPNGGYFEDAYPVQVEVRPLSFHYELARQSPAVWIWPLPALFILLQLLPRKHRLPFLDRKWPTGVLLFVLALFTFHFLRPAALFSNSMTVGGDTPAHNYVLHQLIQTWWSEARIVSWAPGWWCGFPLFQFYFPLPYLCMAVLELVVPFHIAFKLVTVAGALTLPCAAFFLARSLGARRPVPEAVSCGMMVLLFDAGHTMWGVNLRSTLAGMIASSFSFSWMLVFIGLAWNDISRGRPRLRTIGVGAAVVLSHFFTSIVAGIVLCAALFDRRTNVRLAARLRAACALGAGVGALTAWWLIPLIAKQDYSVEFGFDWTPEAGRTFFSYLPLIVRFGLPLALFSIVDALRYKRAFPAALAWMGAVSTLLFCLGTRAHPVFVNVRLWPFLLFALLALEADGLARLLGRLRFPVVGVAALLPWLLLKGIDNPTTIAYWADWNFSGAESKPEWPVLQDLVERLRGTPGRLANDLHRFNNVFGSDRIFEAMPFLCGKPVIEGGLVNSGIGSLWAYYVQGATSEQAAGAPNLVNPPSFNITNATHLLAWLGVQHFIARGEIPVSAFLRSERWRLIYERHGWHLFEAVARHYDPVVVLARPVRAVVTRRWKEMGLRWIETPGAWNQTYVFLSEPIDDPAFSDPPLSEDAFLRHLESLEVIAPESVEPFEPAPVTVVEDCAERLRFTTSARGRPHLIKRSFFPNWRVRGARAVYLAAPGFMLVVPEADEVVLYYGATLSDAMGLWISRVGVLALLWIAARNVISRLARPRPRSAVRCHAPSGKCS